jgi:hydroxymethylpyrimidine pyrophosphatase-like HAD family hydrolase
MRFLVLASDYDGTIARNSTVDDATLAALGRFKQSGRQLILVTGRELHDLFNVFDSRGLFDVIVAENGGVLYRPATERLDVLAAPPAEELTRCLRKEGVHPLSIGRTIVSTQETYRGVVEHIVQKLGLDLHLVSNKGALMVLPPHIDKATGLLSALAVLKRSPGDVVGVGDAENDQGFLQLCGLSVAVANALPCLKQQVHYITHSSHGAGVQELIAKLLGNELETVSSASC